MAWDVVPDLAIEVMSPYDLAEESLQKIHDTFTRVFNSFGSFIPKNARSMSTKLLLASAFWLRTTLWTAGQSYPVFSCAWIASLIRLRRRIEAHKISSSSLPARSDELPAASSG